MFGEEESESPRVPSPWDSLMSTGSTPAIATPTSRSTPSPLPSPLGTPADSTLSISSATSVSLPRLPPESDSGNIEYKLQLLHPTPSRFTRLVTQLKWRLLEGGGQAYYELGVSDAGLLVGLSRKNLEETLDTLEMMAGEIGASVVVVKEIEVERNLAEMARKEEDYRERSGRVKERFPDMSYSDTTTTDATDSDTSIGVFTMDDPSDDNLNAAPSQASQTPFIIDLGVEISSVFKPRPMTMRMRMSNSNSHIQNANGKNSGNGHGHKPRKKLKPLLYPSSETGEANGTTSFGKTHSRRQARDKRRAEKRKALEAFAGVPQAAEVQVDPSAIADTTDVAEKLVEGLETLHVSHVDIDAVPIASEVTVNVATSATEDIYLNVDADDVDADDDVFPSPAPSKGYHTLAGVGTTTTPLDGASAQVKANRADSRTEKVDEVNDAGAIVHEQIGPGKDKANHAGQDEEEGPRLIVEALVVRKLSLQEAFLDFGGFGLELS